MKKQFFVLLLIGILVFASLPLTASSEKNSDVDNPAKGSQSGDYSTKDEVIYGNLDATGQIVNMYVVNSFHITTPGEILDYGNYNNVRNLTDLTDIDQSGNDEVYFQAEETFYYQGELENKPLPWDISITYMLDGKEMKPDELAGRSGDLEIQISTSANEKVDPLFFENYLLQISLTLDPEIFQDIQAPKGTEANEGRNKLVSFSVMPEQEEVLIVSARVKDLEIDPIEISAIPANIAIEDIDLDDMTGDMETLSDAIREINSGVADLNEGISELNSGAAELSSGSTEYLNGINELDQSSGELVSGSKDILNALQQLSEAMKNSPDVPDMGELKALPKELRDMAEGLKEMGSGLDQLRTNYKEAYGALDQAILDIPDSDMKKEQLEAYFGEIYQSGVDEEFVKHLNETYTAAQTVKQTYLAGEKAFAAVTTTLKNVTEGMEKISGGLEAMADGIEEAMAGLGELDALEQLQDGFTTLSSEYQTFHNGLVTYTEGVNSLATSYTKIDTATEELSAGVAELKQGSNQLHDGTMELEESTSDLPDQMQAEVDKFMEEYNNSDFEPASFVSNKNKHVGVVQFVLKTESIEVEEPETAPEEKEEQKGFWDRFMDLFR